MNIECVICLKNLQVMEDAYSTPCGHVFHSSCISQWFERSSTCPECRKEVPGKKLARIFFNFVDENTIMEEFTLPLELEIKSLRDQLMVKDGVIAQGIMREQDLCEKNNQLQEEIRSLTTSIRDNVAKLEESTVKKAHYDLLMDLFPRLFDTFKEYVQATTPSVLNSTNRLSVE